MTYHVQKRYEFHPYSTEGRCIVHASMTLHLSSAEYGVNSNTKTGKIVAINAFYLTLPIFSGKI